MREQHADIEYRRAAVRAHWGVRIPFQIRAMRLKRDINTRQLAEAAGLSRRVMAEMESTGGGTHDLRKLAKVADAMDVALIVKFVPFSELGEFDFARHVPSYTEENP